MDRETQESLIRTAQERGYLEIKEGRIRYLCARVFEDDYTDAEEPVRAAVYSWLILEREYAASHIKVEVPIPRRVPGDSADIVVYEDEACRSPYLVVENKPRGELDNGIEQVFGNANSLRTTKLALFDNLDESRLFDVQNYPQDERSDNILGPRDALPRDFGRPSAFRLVAGSPNDIRPVSARELENRVRRAHAKIWSGGRRDPLTSFDEWSKLLFAKVHDERATPNGQPRRLQVGANETAVRVANRVRALLDDARAADPTIFTAPIQLPDDKIREVVRIIEEVGFTLSDLDALGTAFESFFGSIFRGDLGQYFTRRELVRFICAMLSPNEQDIVLDPTAGSGGFLLEVLMQVWRKIDRAYQGRPELERRKYDFAHGHVFGIEIHPVLGRVCQTNLMLHRDGHTNIEVNRSCLDSNFTNPGISADNPRFTLVVGNPPFGDKIEEGDTDHLGSSRLSDFEVVVSKQIKSEIVILERAVKFLRPGGRLGMIVPDGLLNNSGENSRCPALRRFLLRSSRILAVVSLPDFAFRKAGAQNKTSILFVQRFTPEERRSFQRALSDHAHSLAAEPEWQDKPEGERHDEALARALADHAYQVFLAEAQAIGYTPAGRTAVPNDLYAAMDREPLLDDEGAILGQYMKWQTRPEGYVGMDKPPCMSIRVDELFRAHPSHRLDPKYFLFKRQELHAIPSGTTAYPIGRLLEPVEEEVVPSETPDREFVLLTLTQDGFLEPREAGKGNSPPDWHGAYLEGSWWQAHGGDVVVSRIDLWKGCVAVIPPQFDGAIVTKEFPLYRVRDTEVLRPHYLRLLLRTRYFQEAIRAITTGHSNRRRTQEVDFDSLVVFLPDVSVQDEVVRRVIEYEGRLTTAGDEYKALLERVDECIMGNIGPEELLGRDQREPMR